MKLSPHSLTPVLDVNGIRSLVGFGKLGSPLVHPEPYHRCGYTRLALKLFRRERAITEFDWPFTPTLSSSKPFSTDTGSGLRLLLHNFHPGQG